MPFSRPYRNSVASINPRRNVPLPGQRIMTRSAVFQFCDRASGDIVPDDLGLSSGKSSLFRKPPTLLKAHSTAAENIQCQNDFLKGHLPSAAMRRRTSLLSRFRHRKIRLTCWRLLHAILNCRCARAILDVACSRSSYGRRVTKNVSSARASLVSILCGPSRTKSAPKIFAVAADAKTRFGWLAASTRAAMLTVSPHTS